MPTVRFSNETDQPIDRMVEPWGMVEAIPPGSRFAIHFSTPVARDDTSHAEYHTGMIRFWCEGDSYELEIDGRVVPS